MPGATAVTRAEIALFEDRRLDPVVVSSFDSAFYGDPFRTHLAHAPFPASPALHADMANTQNCRPALCHPPDYSHSETNRPGANFHTCRIPRSPYEFNPIAWTELLWRDS